MAGKERGRSRRLTELLLSDYVSSGSEHEAGDLSGVVDGIFFSDEEDLHEFQGDESEQNPSKEFNSFPAAMLLKEMISAADPAAAVLAERAAAAGEQLAALRSNRAGFIRAVMTSLRVTGYNAGVCKARWESRGGVTAGCYEYIDVVLEKRRYIVEVYFKEEFEIARPTAEYDRILEELPRVYVGKAEELKRVIRVLGDAAKRSLQSREMHVPPWRKSQYMQVKWLGAYRRTVNPNPVTAAVAASPCFGVERDVKCRVMGFYQAAPLSLAPAARTR